MKDELLRHKIMQSFRQGDPVAFEKIYNSYYYTIYGFAFYYLGNEEDAEDITADTFVKLWNRRTKFETLDNVLAFLRITTRHACLDFLKTKKNNDKRINDLKYLHACDQNELFNDFEIKNEVLKFMHHVIGKLPPKSRQVMQLSLQGHKIAEIAQRLNVSPQTVMNQKTTAIKIMRAAVRSRKFMLLFLPWVISFTFY